jgi:hypothetical protein
MATELKDQEAPLGTAANPEVMQPETALAKPSLPVTIEDLAALPEEEGVAIIEGRQEILDTLRKASILLTHPQDWVLYKAENRITCYLQDCGCQRVMALWGIDIEPTGGYERIDDKDTEEFAYSCKADGFCASTNRAVKAVQGLRLSTEDVVKNLPRLQKSIRVRQLATANRDGNIVRMLTGLKSVAIEELDSVWKAEGKGKSVALCVPGRGYGSQKERQGAQANDADKTSDPGPKCPTCGAKMNFRKAGSTTSGKAYGAFWGCSKFKSDGCKGSVQDSDYQKSKPKPATYGEGADPDPALDRAPGEEG